MISDAVQTNFGFSASLSVHIARLKPFVFENTDRIVIFTHFCLYLCLRNSYNYSQIQTKHYNFCFLSVFILQTNDLLLVYTDKNSRSVQFCLYNACFANNSPVPELHIDNEDDCKNGTCNSNDVVDLADHRRVLARCPYELNERIKSQRQEDNCK